MDRVFFSQENLTNLMKQAIDEIQGKIPNQAIDQKVLINILTGNMKQVINQIDKSKITTNDIKTVIPQLNRLSLLRTVGQVLNSPAIATTAPKIQRDQQIASKLTPSLGMSRPTVVDKGIKKSNTDLVERSYTPPNMNSNFDLKPMETKGKRTSGNTYEDMLKERSALDDSMGVRGPQRPTQQQVQAQQPTVSNDVFSGLSNDYLSDLDSYEMSVTQGIDIDEAKMESYEDRLRRINKEREASYQPAEATEDFSTSTEVSTTTPIVSIEQRANKAVRFQESDAYLVPKEEVVVQRVYEAPTRPNIGEFVEIETKKGELLELSNQLKRAELALETQAVELKKRELLLIEMENKVRLEIKPLTLKPYNHFVIDSRNFDNVGMNNYTFSFGAVQKNATRLEFVNISVPTINNNLHKDYALEYNQNRVNVKAGSYSLSTLISTINEMQSDFTLSIGDNGCVLIHSEQEIQIVDGELWKKLGFLGTKPVAVRAPDLRKEPYLHFYLHNLSNEPVSEINPANFTPFNLDLKEKIDLNSLSISYRYFDKALVDFKGLYHTIEFRVHFS